MCNCLRLPVGFFPWFMPDDLYYSMQLLLPIYVVNGICVTVCTCLSGLIPGLCQVICIIVCYYCYVVNGIRVTVAPVLYLVRGITIVNLTLVSFHFMCEYVGLLERVILSTLFGISCIRMELIYIFVVDKIGMPWKILPCSRRKSLSNWPVHPPVVL